MRKNYPLSLEHVSCDLIDITQQTLGKHKKIKIFSALTLVNENRCAFAILIAKAYEVTDYLCKDYPNYFNWFWLKTIPAVINGTREIFVCTISQEIAGIVILKKEDCEQKICTFLVLESFRGKHLAAILLEKSFDFLGTTKPLISIASDKLDMLKNIVKRYGWKQTQVLNKGYYNKTSQEIVFNGKIL